MLSNSTCAVTHYENGNYVIGTYQRNLDLIAVNHLLLVNHDVDCCIENQLLFKFNAKNKISGKENVNARFI